MRTTAAVFLHHEWFFEVYAPQGQGLRGQRLQGLVHQDHQGLSDHERQDQKAQKDGRQEQERLPGDGPFDRERLLADEHLDRERPPGDER